jgi:polysaccharide chain length determinant protein (PEP-CTERM system associated)
MEPALESTSASTQLRRALAIPLRHPILLVVPIVLGLALAALSLYSVPKKYISSTVILVETDTAPEAFVKGKEERQANRLATVRQEILSRTRLEKVLGELQPYTIRKGASLTPVIERMRANITISVRDNDAFSVDFVHTKPEMARDVANRLAGLFIEESSRVQEAQTKDAEGFIEGELEKAKKELEQIEVKLQAFKERHIGDLPEQLQANLAALQRLQLERQAIAQELSADLGRLSALEGSTRAVGPAPGDPREAELAQLKAELAALRTRYTEEHPDVRTLMGRIARLERSLGEGPVPGGGPSAPATTAGAAQLREAQLRVRSLQARQSAIEQRLAAFQTRVEQTPRTEEELTTLTRDYEKLKERYLNLLNQKMNAKLKVAIEQRWKGERFRVLDPAHLPTEHFYPNPRVFLALGLAGGLLVGLALCVGAELLDQSVKTPAQLQTAISFPVLAIIPHVDAVAREAAPDTKGARKPAGKQPLVPATSEPTALGNARLDPVAPRALPEPTPSAAPPPALEQAVSPPVAPARPAAEPMPEAVTPEPVPSTVTSVGAAEAAALSTAPPIDQRPHEPPAAQEAGEPATETRPLVPSILAAPVEPILQEPPAAAPAKPATEPVPLPAPARPPSRPPHTRVTRRVPHPARGAQPVASESDPYGLLLPSRPRRVEAPVRSPSEGGSELWSAILTGTPAPPPASAEASSAAATVAAPPESPDTRSRIEDRAAVPAAPSLTLSTDNGLRLALHPSPEAYLVGSSGACHLTVEAPQVETVHAQIVATAAGLQISDAGTLSGTYVNGRRILAAQPLKPGDEVFLGSPGSRQSMRLVVSDGRADVEASRLPAPGVPAASLPERWWPRPQAPSAIPEATRRSRETGTAVSRPAPARAGTGARPVHWLVVSLVLFTAAAAALWPARGPRIVSVEPLQAEPGATVTLVGDHFGSAADGVVVRFADQTATVASVSPTKLQVAVPSALMASAKRDVTVVVEAGGRSSNPVSFTVTAPPRITSLQPRVAWTDIEVTAFGHNLSRQPLRVQVGGVPAALTSARSDAFTFRIPPGLPLVEGSRVPLTVEVAGERTNPVEVILGHVPVITGISPAQGPPGQRVVLTGDGFDPSPAGNTVRFGGNPALIFSASPTELVVASPAGSLTASQRMPVIVETGGRKSLTNVGFTTTHPTTARYLPRFFPAPVPGHETHDHAFVSSDLGPVLLLTGRGDSTTTAERAARAALALNDLVAVGARPLVLSYRSRPTPAVVLAGGDTALAVATPVDAAAYGEAWEGGGRSASVTPERLAEHWTSLLQDYLALFVAGERPMRVVDNSRGRVLLDIHAAAGRATTDSSVPQSVVRSLRPATLQALRRLALVVPATSRAPVSGAAIGRWRGIMEEGDSGKRQVELNVSSRAGRLEGTLSAVAGTATVSSPLRNVTYDQGRVQFVSGTAAAPLYFTGTVRSDILEGTIFAGTSPQGTPVGVFSLSYAK